MITVIFYFPSVNFLKKISYFKIKYIFHFHEFSSKLFFYSLLAIHCYYLTVYFRRSEDKTLVDTE